MDQPLVLLLQLHAAPQIISVGPDSTQSTIQLTLQGGDRQYQDLNMFACSFPAHVTKTQQLAHLQLCGLVEDSSRQVVSVGLLQQGAHLLHLLLQRLLHLNHRLEEEHTHTHTLTVEKLCDCILMHSSEHVYFSDCCSSCVQVLGNIFYSCS